MRGATCPGASGRWIFRAGATGVLCQCDQEAGIAALRRRGRGNLRGPPILPVTEELVFAAMDAKVRHQISYWDAAIIAAAEALGAREFYSEDLNDGQMYGSVRVVNPFK